MRGPNWNKYWPTMKPTQTGHVIAALKFDLQRVRLSSYVGGRLSEWIQLNDSVLSIQTGCATMHPNEHSSACWLAWEGGDIGKRSTGWPARHFIHQLQDVFILILMIILKSRSQHWLLIFSSYFKLKAVVEMLFIATSTYTVCFTISSRQNRLRRLSLQIQVFMEQVRGKASSCIATTLSCHFRIVSHSVYHPEWSFPSATQTQDWLSLVVKTI